MRRGEIWTVSGRGPYAGKPRPAVIIQADRFADNDSIAVCALTTDQTEALFLRLPVTPSDSNGLRTACSIMVDKITTMPRNRMGRRIGQLEPEAIQRLDQALIIFLGLASRRRLQSS